MPFILNSKMEKEATYLNLYKEILAIDKELLEDKKRGVPDLFLDSRKADLLSFLQPTNLIQHIKPISSLPKVSININRIAEDPKKILYEYLDSSYGKLLIASTDIGICYISFTSAIDLSELQKHFPNSILENRATDFQKAAIDYIDNKSTDSLALHLKGTDFQLQVWQQLCKIPKKQVSTYKHIAIAINKPKASIAIGAAVGRNPVALLIPCHRVIRSNGLWQGFKWSNERKATLLCYELR